MRPCRCFGPFTGVGTGAISPKFAELIPPLALAWDEGGAVIGDYRHRGSLG